MNILGIVNIFVMLINIIYISGSVPVKISNSVANQTKIYLNIHYEPECTLNIYAPNKAVNSPVVIFVPGGGFEKLNITSGALILDALMFVKHGVIFVPITYQLLPKNYPIQWQDVGNAIKWVKDNISKYGGDPNSIFIMGHSAGAVISAMDLVTNQFISPLELSDIKGVILVEGAYDFELLQKIAPERFKKALLMFPNATNEQIFALSPSNNIGDYLPPHLLIYADQFAWTKAEALVYYEDIRLRGYDVQLFHAIGDNHSSVISNLSKVGNKTMIQILSFIYP